MSHFSLLIGYDTKQLGLKQICSHYGIKAIAVVDDDVCFESQLNIQPFSKYQGVVELNFQKFVHQPILLLQVSCYTAYESQMYQTDTFYYHTAYQLQFISDSQIIEFSLNKNVIISQCALTGIEFDAMTCLPLIEINFNDFRLPQSGKLFSSHFAVEVQTDTFKIIKYMGNCQADLSQILFPFQQEFLLKLVYVMQIYGIQHQFTIANARILNSQQLIKGAVFEITEIAPKLDAKILSLIDNISYLIQNGIDEARDEAGNKIKLSGIANPQFLWRYVLYKNPKLLTVNLQRFQYLPPIVQSDDKKLQKLLEKEYLMCDDLGSQFLSELSGYEINASMLCVMQTFPANQKTQELQYKEITGKQKSVAIAAIKLNPPQANFGFCILSNKEFLIQNVIQQFEVGTGNLAYCNPADKKQFLQLMHRTNYSQTVKLLANSTKSLISAAKAGLTLNCFVYEKSVPYAYKEARFSQDAVKQAVCDREPFIEEKLSSIARLRLYVQDLIYCQKNGVDGPGMPEESFVVQEADGSQANASIDDLNMLRTSIASRMSFVAHTYKKQFDPQRFVDYYGKKIKNTEFIYRSDYVKTLQQFIDEENERLRREAEERKAAEELRKQQEEEEEKKKAEEEAKKQQEEAAREQQRIEEERLEQERLEKERLEEERIAEQRRLEEEERQRQIEQIKFMQMKKKFGGGGGQRTARKFNNFSQKIKSVSNSVQQIKINDSLIKLKMAHTAQQSAKSSQIVEQIRQNQQKLKDLQIEFEKQTLEMQFQFQLAEVKQQIMCDQYDIPVDEQQEQQFQDQMAFELYHLKNRLEKEQNSKLDKLNEQYQKELEKDQNEMLERKKRLEKSLMEQKVQQQMQVYKAQERQKQSDMEYQEYLQKSKKEYKCGENTE